MRALLLFASAACASLALAGDGISSGNALLKRFEGWFSSNGGQWGTGITPEAIASPCARIAGQSSFRVVSRLRVPKNSVSGIMISEVYIDGLRA